MTRSVLMATTAIIALLASNAAPARGTAAFAAPTAGNMQRPLASPKRVLYNQNSNDAGGYVASDCFTTSSTPCFQAAADDFIVPTGKHWKIGEVDVTGVYYQGNSSATSVNVVFYEDNNGLPGNPVTKGTYNNLNCGADASGSFKCHLKPKKLRLGSGHYWVSVQANISGGAWAWEENSVIHNDHAAMSCGGSCWQSVQDDLMFELQT